MVGLDRLVIRGIRSFDDKSIQKIDFYSPVTVIVGHNGSGKTTIIECLKYATTGDQPPNTRGGSFIHDPKLSNEQEVKALVMLNFYAANGFHFEASRNLSAVVKNLKGDTKMRTLECTLIRKDVEGTEKRAAVISTKCAEMDTEIPHLLGVSKAVLENVIFCHQEDSYWPLAESGTLKKKFDDIFEATKYTKALDAIKSLHKEKKQEVKTEKAKLHSLTGEKARFNELKTCISDLAARIASKSIDHEDAMKHHQEQVDSNEKLKEESDKFRQIHVTVSNLASTKQQYRQELEALRETLQELAGTDEELWTRLNNFDSHVAGQKRKKAAQDAQISDLKDEIEGTRNQHSQKVSEHGQLLAGAEAHKSALQGRERLIKDLAEKYNMKEFESTPLDRDQILDFTTKLTEYRQRLDTELENLKAEQKRKSSEYNARNTELHSEREGYRSREKFLQEQSTTLRNQVDKDQCELDDAKGLASKYKTVKADLEEKENCIQRDREEFKDAKYDERIRDHTTKRQELTTRHYALTDEMGTITKQAQDLSDLDHTRNELKRKESDLKNTLAVSNPKFRKLASTDARPETMEREVDCLRVEKEAELVSLENSAKALSKEANSLEASLMSLRSQVQEKFEEMKGLDKEIGMHMDALADAKLPPEPHQATLKSEEEVSRLGSDVNAAKGAGPRLKEFRKLGKEKNCCPLCDRNMNSQELRVFEIKVDEELAKTTPTFIEETERLLAEWERTLKELQIVSQRVTSRDKLSNIEIPALEIQIQKAESELSEAASAADEAAQCVNAARKESDELLALKHEAASIVKIHQDIKMLQQDIDLKETALLGAASIRTIEEVQSEDELLKAGMKVVDRDYERLTAEKERKGHALDQQDIEIYRLKMKGSELDSKLREKAALENRVKEARKEIEDVISKLRELDVKISQIEPVVEQLEQEHLSEDNKLKSKIVTAERAIQECVIGGDKLAGSNKTIKLYVHERGDHRLKECAAEVIKLKDQITELERKRDDATKVGDALAKEIHESTATVANLRVNIRARKLVKEIADVQTAIDKYDLEEAEKAERLLEQEQRVASKKESELQIEAALISGELRAYKEQLSKLRIDLEELKDVGKQYRNQLIKVKLSEMANNDLEKYAKAIDSAIMKYHLLKMEEVNDTMRHLWNKTYQGTDIDGIKICSTASEMTEDQPRSYKYRVVMMKDQVEMDMRGRCSAGQKMLASIIIRLALADSFGQNCGILALDEPTNALDTENIAALASSLGDIINERKHHANFQLIIITHDEQFLRKLGEVAGIEKYWRVSRNSRQKSVITQDRLLDWT